MIFHVLIITGIVAVVFVTLGGLLSKKYSENLISIGVISMVCFAILFILLLIKKENDFYVNETKEYVIEEARQGYLTNDIKIEIQNDFISNDKDISKLQIEGSSKDDKSKKVYLKLTYGKAIFFESAEKEK